jgi:DNA invertase Pin-like site-specific DNA recombinase
MCSVPWPSLNARLSANAPKTVPEAARARGKKGGRPPALVAKDFAAAKAMLSDPEITMEEVVKRLRVAPSTLYRHLPGGRGTLQETEPC